MSERNPTYQECWVSFAQPNLRNYETANYLDRQIMNQFPVWIPTAEQIQRTHISALMQELYLDSYKELHGWAARHRAEFWELMVRRLGIRFAQSYKHIVDLSQGCESPQWLVGARLNIVESCFQAPADHLAIIAQSEGSPLITLTVAELEALTNRVANGLVEMGLQPGDAIAIAMPMTPEAVAVFLGIIKAGCVVVAIADSFAAAEIATRLCLAKAKAIFTQDLIQRSGKRLPLYAKVIEAEAPIAIVRSHTSRSSVELRPVDLTWDQFLSSNSEFDAIPTDPAAHTTILFSSGTTGTPKAIPWTQTTPIKCASDAYLHHDIHPGDVVAWYTNLGWMMGPWLVYASLINQAAIALYDGIPTERGYGQFIEKAQVTMLGVVPSLVNCWKTTGCMEGLDWSRIKAFSSTGECSNPDDMSYLMALANHKPIIEYCGGTEIGGAYITGTLVQPAIPATFTTPALGLDVVILDEAGHPADQGEAFILPPSIGLSTTLLNQDHHQVYFADTPVVDFIPSNKNQGTLDSQSTVFLSCLRRHGDRLERLPNGYYRAHGRVDDTMNLSGIKVSSTEIEQALNFVDEVCETAAIALPPRDGGPNRLIIYAVVAQGAQTDENQLKAVLQTAIKEHLNPLFKIHKVVIVDALPRTASNKVMRRVLRDQALTNGL